jgi:hypothetical protein
MNHGVKSAGPGDPVLWARNRNGRHMLSPVTMAEQLATIPNLARDVLVDRWTEAMAAKWTQPSTSCMAVVTVAASVMLPTTNSIFGGRFWRFPVERSSRTRTW